MTTYLRSFAGYFYPEKKKTSLVDDVVNHLIKEITEITKDVCPDLDEELKTKLDEAKKDLKSQITKENVKNFVDSTICKMEPIYENILQSFSNYPNFKEQAIQAVETNKMKLNLLNVDLTGIEAKKKLAQTYSKLICNKNKKTIKIIGVGNSQQGKTSTLKYLFQLSDDKLKIKNNCSSDTSDITEYTASKYNIELIYFDCPGTSDSRGKEYDKRNRLLILNHLKKHPDTDVIFWVSKLDRIVDLAQQETIELFGNQIDNIWQKTIIILTCSNSSPVPDSYFDELDGINNDEKDDKITEINAIEIEEQKIALEERKLKLK